MLSGCAADVLPVTARSTDARIDDTLIASVEPRFATVDGAQVAVALVDEDGARVAFLGDGTDAATAFEVGSITKTLTGLLLADAIERGEVALDDPIGSYLALGETPAASVTFRELASHTSGLPTFPSDPGWIARVEAGFLAGRDVIDESVDDLLAEAAAEPIPTDAAPQYSNLGAALAGQALASAAGTDYRTLLEDRLLGPLGMRSASLPVEDGEAPPSLASGFRAEGEPAEPSTLGAYAPAGGLVATIDDMIAYASGVLDGPFSGSAALEPHHVPALGEEADSIGYFWGLQHSADGHALVEHGGVTAGFTASLVIDRTGGRAAVVLTNLGDLGGDGDALAKRVLESDAG